jgi:hypothetical protein
MDATQRILELSGKGLSDKEIADKLKVEGVTNAKGENFTLKSVQARRLRARKKRSETSDGSDGMVVAESSDISEGAILTAASEVSGISDAPPSFPASEPSDISDVKQGPKVSETSEASGAQQVSEISDSSDVRQSSEVSDISEINNIASDASDVSESIPLPETWRRQIIQIVQTEIQAMFQSQTVPKLQAATPDLPPTPPEKIPGEKGRPVNPGGRAKIAGTVDKRLEELFQEWRESKGITLSRALDAALWHFLGKPKLSFERSDTAETSDETQPDAWSVLHATQDKDHAD